MSYAAKHKSNPLYFIPTQTINLYKLLAYQNKTFTSTIKEFEISEQVTYKEYKEYLSSVKKDSSEEFYLIQLPDNSIGSIEVYKRYLTHHEYDNSPVIGISWESAMNFCKWKTIKDNNKHLQFIYRLPNCSEWLAAYSYLSEKKIRNTLNKNFSDWLINTKDETYHFIDTYPLSEKFIFDDVWLHKPDESLTLKRKQVIGNSYLYQQKYLLAHKFSFYANEGYRQVSFRYVKVSLLDSVNFKFNNSILNYWGLNK